MLPGLVNINPNRLLQDSHVFKRLIFLTKFVFYVCNPIHADNKTTIGFHTWFIDHNGQ